MRLRHPSVHPRGKPGETKPGPKPQTQTRDSIRKSQLFRKPEMSLETGCFPLQPCPLSPRSLVPLLRSPPGAGDIVITRGGRPTLLPDNLSMPLTRRFLLACCTVGLIFAQPAPQKQLTARELFYAAAPAPAAVKPVAARPPARRSTAPPAT